MVAHIAWGQPKDVTWSTSSCPPDKYAHAFAAGFFFDLVETSQPPLIIGHDVFTNASGYQRKFVHAEHVSVLCSKERPGDNFSMQQLRAILSGTTLSWDRLDRGNGPITVYLHGGEFQRRTILAVFNRRLGITTPMLQKANVEFVGAANDDADAPYARLVKASAADKNCLVFGLPYFPQNQLAIQKVDNQLPGRGYPLILSIYMYLAEGQDVKAIEAGFRKTVTSRLNAWKQLQTRN